MKTLGLVALFSLLGSLAVADSLAEAARKEKERREKQAKAGATTEKKVVREEDLQAPSKGGAKGTFSSNVGTGDAGGAGSTSSGTGSASPATAPTSRAGQGETGRVTEVDAIRSASRRQLEESYQSISATAGAFVQAIQQYESSNCRQSAGLECTAILSTIGNYAISIAAGMEKAEDAARTGWLNPGEVSAMRQRYGMDNAYWDKLVRLVNQYRRR